MNLVGMCVNLEKRLDLIIKLVPNKFIKNVIKKEILKDAKKTRLSKKLSLKYVLTLQKKVEFYENKLKL